VPDTIEWVKSLVQIMNQNGIAELSVEEDGRKVRLRKTAEPARAFAPAAAAPPAPLASAPAAPAALEPGAVEAPSDVVEVRSPMVGTFYRSPSPEAEPFVEVGDAVTPETTLCIIEAMKVMNEIKAEMEGTIQSILVANGEAVEYGQPLFLIKRR
jgi:acetyl-CoA carboxylase biotin carboxyl carrier protein